MTTQEVALPVPPEEPVVQARTKRRKVRRKNANENKRNALKNNEKIIAWKLAARKQGYFNSLVFKQLPTKGSEDYLAIIAERSKLLNHYWRLACEATQHDELQEHPVPENKEDEEETRKAARTELREFKKKPGYNLVLRQQRQMLSNLIENQEKAQRTATDNAWDEAVDDLGHREFLGDIPKRGTKAFKTRMAEEEYHEKYEATKAAQRDLMGL